MKYPKKIFFSLCLISLSIFSVVPALAQGDMGGFLNNAAGPSGAGYQTSVNQRTYLATVAGRIVQIFISLLGILFISYTLYGGYLWLTAAGNEEKVTKAKSTIRSGIIGLIVILGAAAIYFFIRGFLIGELSGGGAVSGSGI